MALSAHAFIRAIFTDKWNKLQKKALIFNSNSQWFSAYELASMNLLNKHTHWRISNKNNRIVKQKLTNRNPQTVLHDGEILAGSYSPQCCWTFPTPTATYTTYLEAAGHTPLTQNRRPNIYWILILKTIADWEPYMIKLKISLRRCWN